MRYDPSLPEQEVVDGVKIVRANVALRISKGCIAPKFGLLATTLVRKADIVHLHLPQFDAAGVALRARLFRIPCLITYHCDLQLVPTVFNRFVNLVVNIMNDLSARAAHRVVTYTNDYAEHSTYLSRFKRKLEVTLPPVELPSVLDEDIEAYRREFNPDGRRPVIAMAARLAAEKGVEVLLDALPRVFEAYPNAIVVFAGQYQNVMSEEQYAAKVLPRIESLVADGRWKWLGILPPCGIAKLFPNVDLLVVPSLNSTESFGLVQIEAMMNGVPVVASNLPGVRQPVLTSGMGRIAGIGDASSLADCMLEVLGNREAFIKDKNQIRAAYSPASCAQAYEVMYRAIAVELGKSQ
jgi:glycosyltransferase involved in cell wall biosynthesis